MKTIFNISKRLLAVLFIGALMLSSCKKQDDPFGILTFSLTMPNGQTLECVVDQTALTIVNTNDPVEPGMPASQYVMKINYTATLETSVKLGSEAVVSGETTADFSSPVTIVAAKGAKEISYTVTVIEDANDASQTSGKRVNTDMTKSGFPECVWYEITFFNGAFYAMTASYPDGTEAKNPALYDIYKSADGISWTKVNTSIPVTGAYGARLVVFKNKLWAIGGGRFYGTDEAGNGPEQSWGAAAISRFFVSSSADGENWTEEPEVATAGAVLAFLDPRVIVQGDSMVYMGGYSPAFGMFMRMFTVATSTDGITWTAQEGFDRTSPASLMFRPAIYTFKGKTFLAGGFQNYISPGFGRTAVYSTTDNGLTWTEETADGGFGAMWNMRVAGTDDVLYMVGGEYYGEGAPNEEGSPTSELVASNKVFRSTDGINWTELTGENALPDSFVGRTNPCLVVDGDMLWIFGGRGTSADTFGAPVITDEVVFDTWKKKIK